MKAQQLVVLVNSKIKFESHFKNWALVNNWQDTHFCFFCYFLLKQTLSLVLIFKMSNSILETKRYISLTNE